MGLPHINPESILRRPAVSLWSLALLLIMVIGTTATATYKFAHVLQAAQQVSGDVREIRVLMERVSSVISNHEKRLVEVEVMFSNSFPEEFHRRDALELMEEAENLNPGFNPVNPYSLPGFRARVGISK